MQPARDEPRAQPGDPGSTSGGGARTLLGFGILAGPFYLGLGVAQGLLREGFDFARHPLSLLANGPGGWIQTGNFLLSGLMVVAAAVGVHRALGPASRATAWALGTYGTAMILAGIFRADPVDGFPPGTPAGYPDAISTVGMVHFGVGMLAFVSIAVACLLAARPLARRGERRWAGASLLCGLLVLAGFFGGPFLGLGIWGIWAGVVLGWAWLAALSIHLRDQAARARVGTPATSPMG